MTTPTEPDDRSVLTGDPVHGENLVTAGPGLAGHAPRSPGAEVVLHQEQLLISTQRVAVERVQVSKHIVTETRTIEVPVRVEQLIVTREPLDSQESTALGAGERADDLVIVLHEEVPEVTVRVVPTERVVVSVQNVTKEQTISAELAAEVAEVTTSDVA